MNRHSWRAPLAIFVFCFVAMSAACAGGGQNSVGNSSNASKVTANAATEVVPPKTVLPAACTEPVILTRAERVQSAIYDAMKDGTKEQYDAGMFRYLVTVGPDAPPQPAKYLIVYLEGRVKAAGNENKPFKELIKLLDPFVRIECVARVVFVEPGTLPPPPVTPTPTTTATPAAPGTPPGGGPSPAKVSMTFSHAYVAYPGFDWVACDYPTIPCPGGICQLSCVEPTPPIGPIPAATPAPGSKP